MPNRIIKESICTSENLNNLSLEEEVFFYRLITQCDDFGRMDARPQILRAKCFPLRTDTIQQYDIESWLQALVRENLIIIYTVDGKAYLQMVTWDKHQQKRAKKSKYPALDNGIMNLQSSDINCNQVQANVPEKRESRIRESRIRETNTRNEYEKREPDFDPEEIESRSRQVLEKFEIGFGRTLNEIEAGKIIFWMDKHSPELIVHAMEIAVLGNNRSCKYIGGILNNWHDKGVKCIQDVEDLDRKHQEQKKKGSDQFRNRASPGSETMEFYTPPEVLDELRRQSG